MLVVSYGRPQPDFQRECQMVGPIAIFLMVYEYCDKISFSAETDPRARALLSTPVHTRTHTHTFLWAVPTG